ncbi:hypothetical protein DVH05_024245 [Phytophthora capsici]|nr:hypothetical protein DVH05_024245 [Phytophthora capsici]
MTPKGKTKGKTYTKSELMRLLDVVEELLPFGAEQWQNVASQFNTHIPSGWTEREGDSLKRKFQKLVRVPKPSGDGVCPEEVQRAKRLQYNIEAAIAVVDLHEDGSADEQEEKGPPPPLASKRPSPIYSTPSKPSATGSPGLQSPTPALYSPTPLDVNDD